MKSVSISMDAEVRDALDNYAESRLGVKSSGLLKVALKSYLRQRPPKEGTHVARVLKPFYEEV